MCHLSKPMLQISDDYINTLAENEDVCDRSTDLKDVYAKVEKNIAEGQERVRKRKLSKGEDDNFVVGDRVLRKNILQKQRKGGKLEADLMGPFTITHIDGKSVDLKTRMGNTMEKINMDHLKRYVEPQPRIPAKWIAATSTSSSALQPSPLTCPRIPQSSTLTLSPSRTVTPSPQSDALSSGLQSCNTPAIKPSIFVPPEERKYNIQYGFFLEMTYF